MKTRKKKLRDNLLNLVPALYSLAIAGTAMSISLNALQKCFLEEERIRLLEFKLMGAIEIEYNNKEKKEIEYRKINGIDKFIKNFLRQNKHWIYKKEEFTGKIILTRVYRNYSKKSYSDKFLEGYEDYDEGGYDSEKEYLKSKLNDLEKENRTLKKKLK